MKRKDLNGWGSGLLDVKSGKHSSSKEQLGRVESGSRGRSADEKASAPKGGRKCETLT